MGLFKKSGGAKEIPKPSPAPALPELPKLPDFPSMDDDEDDKQIHKLPSFPSSSLGTKFSQDTIKGAVTGEEEDREDANEFTDEDEMRMMQEPPRKSRTMEMGAIRRMPLEMSRTESAEPVFIRVDKFEEAMKVFHQTKKKVSEIEKILEDLKTLKDKEDKQLLSWESEVAALKNQIEKVNTDIFSKI